MEKLKDSKDYIIYVLLGIIIVLLLGRDKTGRYIMTTADRTGVFVLDTKTSQLWGRTLKGNVYFGTNENPEQKAHWLPSDEPKDKKDEQK